MFRKRQWGMDELNRTMLIAGLSLSIIGLFFLRNGTWPRYVVSGLSTALLVLALFRQFRRDQSRSYRENMKFLTVVTAVRDWFRNTFSKRGERTHRARRARKNPTWSEIRQYKYLICPQCTQRLRVPRGKGRIRVTCTHCGNVFVTKS